MFTIDFLSQRHNELSQLLKNYEAKVKSETENWHKVHGALLEVNFMINKLNEVPKDEKANGEEKVAVSDGEADTGRKDDEEKRNEG